MPRRPRSSHALHNHHTQFSFLRLLFIPVFVVLGALFSFFVLLPNLFILKNDENIVIVPSNKDGNKGKIYFAHISASSQKINMYALPSDEETDVSGGFGKYPLRAIYPLLQSEKKDNQAMRSTYSFALRQIIDQVWVEQRPVEISAAAPFSAIPQALLLNSLQSSLTLSEKIQLYEFANSLRPDQITFSSVDNLNQLMTASKNAFPSQAYDCSVAVINTTSVTGLGTKVGDVIELSGFSVLRVTTNSDSSQNNSILIYSGPQGVCSDVIDHIQHLFPHSLSVQEDPNAFTTYRSHITIFLAKDLAGTL